MKTFVVGCVGLALAGCGGKIASGDGDGVRWWCSSKYGTVTYDKPSDPLEHIYTCPAGTICGVQGSLPGYDCCIEAGEACRRADRHPP
jgi:hypothetical protein